MRPLLWVLTLSLLVAACGAPTPEVAAPAPSSTSATPSPTLPPLVALPPRPRDIDTTGVDVCTLLTRQQRQEFGFDLEPVRDDNPLQFYGNNPIRGCSFTSLNPDQHSGILISDKVGIEAWTTVEINGSVQADSVSGFPAITATPAGNVESCTVAVDLAPHVLLDVLFSNGSGKPPIPQPTLCQRAHRTAELVMASLTGMGR